MPGVDRYSPNKRSKHVRLGGGSLRPGVKAELALKQLQTQKFI